MKKTLALVLALVMVIGLMAVPVKADFTDSSSIEYTEAVDVLSAAGVINGFENGSFDPDGNLTREQAAKIVAYLLLGEKNADALVATSAPFSDVAADRWSAGYIAYCVNEGIINGRDAKTFDPTGKVTGYEFAKLLLGCLGYSSKIEQYVGASWAINVAKTALDIDLFDGNDGANYNAPMTREEAALYSFNTLLATVVDYDSQGTSIDLGNGVVISTGASKAEDVSNDEDDDYRQNDLDADELMQFCEKYFEDLVLLDDGADDFGRPASSWEYDGEDVGTYADEADLTYTAEVEPNDIFDDTNEEADTATYFIDGKAQSALTLEDNETEIGGNGTLVEVYYGDDAVTVVMINTYVGQISNWTEADEEDDVEESVDVTDLTVANVLPGTLNDNFETTAFTEDDVDDDTVVLFTAAWDDAEDEYVIQSVVAAESADATPTRFTTTKSFVAGGTTYKYSANYGDIVTTGMVNAENDVTIYLDSYGYAIHVEEIEDSADNYAYVISAQMDDSELFGDAVPMGKLVLATGEVVIVELDEDTDVDAFDGKLVNYSVDSDDVYTLSNAKTPANTANEAALEIVKGQSAMTISGNTYYANSSTVFFVKSVDSDGDDVYDVYTGIANVPGLVGMVDDQDTVTTSDDVTAAAAVSLKTGTKTAEAVFVADADEDSTATSDDVIYVHYDSSVTMSSDVDLGDYYEYNVVSAGEITTLMFDADLVGAGAGQFNEDILLESVEINDDGVVTELGDPAEVQAATTGTIKASNGVIGFGTTATETPVDIDDVYFTYADDCIVFKIDDDEFTASTIAGVKTDINDTVTYLVDEDNNDVIAIFITVE